jgi:hypothetical protein
LSLASSYLFPRVSEYLKSLRSSEGSNIPNKGIQVCNGYLIKITLHLISPTKNDSKKRPIYITLSEQIKLLLFQNLSEGN